MFFVTQRVLGLYYSLWAFINLWEPITNYVLQKMSVELLAFLLNYNKLCPSL